MSLPAWGAWIEIDCTLVSLVNSAGRSPCGECGLKHLDLIGLAVQLIVAPHTGSDGSNVLLSGCLTQRGQLKFFGRSPLLRWGQNLMPFGTVSAFVVKIL